MSTSLWQTLPRRWYDVFVPTETRLYTIEDLESLDGEFELDRGMLVPVMPGGNGHSFVCGEVAARIREVVRSRKLGRMLANDPGFVLERGPDTLRGPDVAFVRGEQLDGLAPNQFVEGGPDLAVEIVSSASARSEAIRKTAQYLDAGAKLVWILDISHRRVIVFQEGGEVSTVREDELLTGGDVLPGFSVRVSELFDGEPV